MSNAARLVLGFVIVSIASLCAVAQQSDPIFLKIELAIRQGEPAWTLMNKWLAPQGQSAGLRWKFDEHEIFAWIILEPSVDEAIKFFEDDGQGPLPNKTPRRILNIGDGAYLRQAGPHTAVVLRKGNLLVRLGSESSGPQLLSRFASRIGAALDGSSVTTSQANEVIDKTKALEALREAVRLRPDWPEAHYRLGTAYYESGDYRAAANAFEEAIRLQPEFFDALIALGKTYQHLGLHARAVEVLQKAVLLRADNIDARVALGAALILAGQPEDAVAVLREAARLGPESALIYGSLGQAYRLSGKFDEALIALEQALRLGAEDAVAHYNLGLTHLARGDRSQAEAEYDVLKRLQSDLAEALLREINKSGP